MMINAFDPLFFNDYFIRAPGGNFRMGTSTSEKQELDAQNIRVWEDESPQHTVYLSEYLIGKVPITNSNYRSFVNEEGYRNRIFWSEAGWNWLRYDLGDNIDISFLKEEERLMWIEQREKWGNYLANRPLTKKNQPYWWGDSKFDGENCPVVGITWFEAEAYCNWLSYKLHDSRTILSSQCVRLPTEAEWENAARICSDNGSLWPWGNTWDSDKCNSIESGIGRTTPVGSYGEGACGLGCLDLIGNVWEWCLDWWDENIYSCGGEISNPQGPISGLAKVKRGGSWASNSSNARSTCRDRDTPIGFFSYVGFRVVIVKEDILISRSSM